MYDLDNGTDVIVVKDAKIVGTNGLTIIKDNDAVSNYSLSIKSTSNGFEVNVEGDIVFRFAGRSDPQEILYYYPLRLSIYDTSSRPASASEGAVLYDSTLKKCILYNGNAWVNLDGTALL